MTTLFSELPSAGEGPDVLQSVSVAGLFGKRSYLLEADPTAAASSRRVQLLYGDNGSGKTAIIRLLFHLLSSEDKRGHKSAVGEMAFNSVVVNYASGARVAAFRTGDAVTGSYTLEVQSTTGHVRHQQYPLDERRRRVSEEISEEDHEATLRDLREVCGHVRFLPDDRRSFDETRRPRSALERYEYSLMSVTPEIEDPRSISLRRALVRSRNWAQGKVLRANSTSAKSVNRIYLQAVRDLASAVQIQTTSESLQSRLRDVSARSNALAVYEFTPPIPIADLQEAMQSAPAGSVELMLRILQPYLDGVEAQLGALEDVHRVTTTAVRHLNLFMRGKTVYFDLRHGFQVRDEDGEDLAPELLSSGERQLLLMFCDVISIRDQSSLFLIDEPELSLNVKWQRDFLSALSELTEGSRVGFLCATHSIEMIADYVDHVFQVRPTKWPR